MFASTANMLLAKTGPLGIELLRKLFSSPSPRGGPVTRFVSAYPAVANRWVGARADERSPLSKEQLETLLNSKKVNEVAAEMGVPPDELLRVIDRALYLAVQMAAPDGMRVSPRAAMQVDEDLVNAIGAAGDTAK